MSNDFIYWLLINGRNCVQTFQQHFEKLSKFLPILVKIVVPPNNLVQNATDHYKPCFFL